MTKRLLFLLVGVFFVLSVKGAICLPDWKYSLPITITNINAATYTNFQVKVVVNTQALISAGKMNASAADVRFTDGNCNNLHYWIDSNLNTTTTVIWVKMLTVPGSGSSKIYMYYGNACANAVQNGDSTFEFFDDFTGAALNTAKWNTYQTVPASCGIALSAGKITISTTAATTENILRTVNNFPGPLRNESKITANYGFFPSIALLNAASFYGVSLYTVDAPSNVFSANYANPLNLAYSSFWNPATAKQNGVWGLSWMATNSAASVFPGGSQTVASTAVISANQHAAIGVFSDFTGSVGTMTCDWVRLRKYAPFEPGFGLNTEVAQSVNLKFYPNQICPGAQLSVVVTKNGVYFNSGNQFNVEMSDATGSFTSPVLLGVINDTIPDTIFYEIPITASASSLYRIRVSTTSPTYNCFVGDSTLTINAKPTVNYTIVNDNQCYKYNNYDFISTSTISSGTISKYIWNWTDGSNNDTFTVTSAKHKYKYYNTYFLTELTAVSNLGCKDVLKKQVNIKEMPSIDAEVNDDIQCLRGNYFKIKSTSFSYTGFIANTNWLFGDGSAMVVSKDSTTHTYATDGIYYISQINQHSDGCIDTAKTFILVNPHPKTKIITNDTNQCLVGNNFIFEANPTVGNGLPMFNDWNIDASVDFTQKDSVHYKYKTQGNRTVRLISITDDGDDACADTTYQIILVTPMPKVSIINYDNTLCLKGNLFRFKAKSTISSGTIVHNWTFGDAALQLNADSTTHSYAAAGTFSVELKGISNYGCRDSIKTTVVVNPTPVPSFTINKSTQCLKANLFKIKSTSTISSGTYTRFWKISDGSSFTGVDSISTKIATIGTYSVKLFLTSNLNCKDSIVDTLKVLEMPIPSFTINNDQQCFRNNSFDFTNNSTFASGLLTGNRWDFADGDSAINQSPVNHKYLTEGDYLVNLIVYANNGCSDTAFNMANVYPHPGTDFLINDTGQCVNNNNFIFKTNTFISSGNFTNKWLFGDGTFSNQYDLVAHKYKKDSTYIVTNISYSNHACADTLTKTVTVYPKPKTSSTINNDKQCKLGNSFNFTSATTIKYGTFTVQWFFGDGNVDGNVVNTQHSYINAQLYKTKLIATSNYGCLDTTDKDARVYPMPVSSFSANYLKSCLQGNNFILNGTSTISSTSLLKYNWYFGDGDSAIAIKTTSHSYLKDSSYTISLITTSVTGNCKDTTTKGVQVFPMPNPSFTIDIVKQCLLNNNFNFNSTSTISSGTIDNYNWSFGDATTGAGSSIAHAYIVADSFKVILTLVTNNLCQSADTNMVYVSPMPVANFTINPKESCLRNNSFAVNNKSTIVNGIITNYLWSYGDGGSSILQNPLPYSYAADGVYIVNLRSTTDKGCWDTANVSISVNPNPILDYDVTEVCFKDSTEFINNSTIASGFISSYKWLFGDGKTSTLESPKHKYKTVNSFDVKLMVVTDKGCKDTLAKPLGAVVNPLPVAKFIYKKLRSWENEVDIQYIDSSTNATSWLWNFSSMGTSTAQNPLLLYTDTLTQLTTLIARNDFGCEDTISEVLFISPDVVYYMPNSFTPGNDDQVNDFFKPVGLAYAKDYKFIIFNRWGEIIFQTDNPQKGWDGTFSSLIVEQDLYCYRLEFVGADDIRHEEKGTVMVLR